MTAAVKAIAALLIVMAIGVMPAAAQGKSGSAPGQNKNKTQGSSGGAPAAAAASPAISTSATSPASSSGSSVLYFGSWLDDASILEPGAAWVGLSTAYWKGDVARQIDAPVIMGALGIGPRAQIGGSVPIYHFRDQDGLSTNGIGTVSFYGKLRLIDPAATGGVGLAITPMLDIAKGGEQRFGWALPVNLEARTERLRVYGSAGYFSRGSVFGTIAVEAPAGRRTSVTGNFGRSYSGGFHQTDIGIGLALSATPASGVFLSLGRSFRPNEMTSGGFSLGGGISLLLPSR